MRPLMPFTAGTSGMSYRRFLPYDVLGAGPVERRPSACSATSSGGASSRSRASPAAARSRSRSWSGCSSAATRRSSACATPSSGSALAALARAPGASGPLLRPLAWLVRGDWACVLRPVWRYVLRPLWLLIAPPLRFLIARLTPGELGIELTTLLAIAAVGIYLVVLQINLLETDALLPGDNTALDIARDIEIGPADRRSRRRCA